MKRTALRSHSPSVEVSTRETPVPDAARRAPPAAVEVLDFTSIFRDNAPFVWRLLRRLGVAERDLPDVVQEVFVVVHRNLPGFEGRSSVRTWVYGICVRAAADHRRRAHVRREVPGGELPDDGAPAPQEEALDLERARATLDRLLSQLDPDKRAVYVLFEIEQVPMEDVARAVGCPTQTAYSRYYAAREHMHAAARRLRLRGRST